MATTGKKLPLWKVILFSLLPTLILFGLLEGAAQAYFYYKETQYFESVKEKAEEVLANDAINYMKEADGRLGYRLKRNLDHSNVATNAEGFFQRDTIPLEKKPGVLRIAALGESTTQGHHVDSGNYPIKLKQLIQDKGQGYDGVEMINGGVAGWISDQVTLLAETKIADYAPDLVVLYVGWNDFQSYDPFRAPPRESYFAKAYGKPIQIEQSGLKSVAVAVGLYELVQRQFVGSKSPKKRKHEIKEGEFAATAAENYSYYIANVRRIVQAFRQANPEVRIAISTLVDRWRVMPKELFESNSGHIWWMPVHGVSQERAAQTIERFNALVREIARDEGLLLVDSAEAFSGLDKNSIFTPASGPGDFAHMYGDGYEQLSRVFYNSLIEAGYIEGEALQQ